MRAGNNIIFAVVLLLILVIIWVVFSNKALTNSYSSGSIFQNQGYPTGIVRYVCNNMSGYSFEGDTVLEISSNTSCSISKKIMGEIDFETDGILYSKLDPEKFTAFNIADDCTLIKTKYDIIVADKENKVYGCNGIEGV